jgi:hypothetical protein
MMGLMIEKERSDTENEREAVRLRASEQGEIGGGLFHVVPSD